MPRQKSADKQAALSLAATELFLRDGIRATSIRDIAERAEVAVGTFYLYFENKVSLIRHIAYEFKKHHEALSESVLNSAAPPSGKLPSYLLALFDMWQPFGADTKGAREIAEAVMYHASETLDSAEAVFLKTVGSILEEGQKSGMLVVDPVTEARWIALCTSSFYPLAGTPHRHPLRNPPNREGLEGLIQWILSKLDLKAEHPVARSKKMKP